VPDLPRFDNAISFSADKPAGALVVASAAIFNWHWQNRTGQARAAKADPVAARRYAIIRDTAEYFESSEYSKHNIFFPVATGYLNPTTLLFEFEKRHLGGLRFRYPFSCAGRSARGTGAGG
jgi:hypothetical protein